MLRIRGLTKRFGGLAAISDVTMEFPAGSLTRSSARTARGKAHSST